MTTFWCEHAVLPGGVRRSVRVVTDGGRILDVRPEEPAEPGDTRLAGVVLPGLANGHSHAFHRALRGRTHDDGGNFWTWREAMYAVTHRLDPETYHALAKAVFAEMLLAGYTVVGEFHYVHHAAGGRRYDDPNVMGKALISAAREVGIRITLLDTCYLAGGLTAGGHVPLDEVQQRFSDGTVDAWAERVAPPVGRRDRAHRCGGALGAGRAARRPAGGRRRRGPRRSAAARAPVRAARREPRLRGLLRLLADRAARRGRGCSPRRTTLVHATHLSDNDIELLGAARATACFCPTTERDLADGIGPARRLHDVGVRLALGSDQHAVIDPFEEMRGVEMHERLESLERGRFAGADLLAMAALNGYRALGWDDGGLIASGHLADLVAVRLDSPRTAGCGPGRRALRSDRHRRHRRRGRGEQVVSDGPAPGGRRRSAARDAIGRCGGDA